MNRACARTLVGVAITAVSSSAFAADLPVDRYLNNPSLGGSAGGGRYYPTHPPPAPAPTYRAPAPQSVAPSTRREYIPSSAPPGAGTQPPSVERVDRLSPWMIWAWLVLATGVVAFFYEFILSPRARRFSMAASDSRSDEGAEGRGRAQNARFVVATNAMPPAMRRSGFPSQDDWTRRAGTVRNPVSGFVFGVRARANARALDEEQKRMKSARGVIKEYAGMYRDLVEGEEVATAHAVRRDLSAAHYEHERTKQMDVFEDAAHRRKLAGKRREKELTEADTRRIEAEHEQEAVERFKEPKFAAGMARFEAKSKEHLVGAATADAAIAETKEPTQPPGDPGNESAEVMQLYRLLQSTMAAIEEGERLGRDTQALRERAALYKKLLNLA